MKAYDALDTRQTPQTEPILGEAQVKNNAGGYVYALDKWAALSRFLVLGTEGSTYYATQREHTLQAGQNLMACLAEDACRVVDEAVAVSVGGRAQRNDPAIVALAMAASFKPQADAAGRTQADVRAYALSKLRDVCRIPTHLFHFVEFVQKQRGWGRSLKRAVARWYEAVDADQFAFHAAKYPSRDGVSHADVLRLAHPNLSADAQAVARWVLGVGRDERAVDRNKVVTCYRATGELPAVLQAVDEARTAPVRRIVDLVSAHRLTREMLPTEALTHAEVWEALLPHMGLTALLRNLATMTRIGLLKPMSSASEVVAQRLRDGGAYAKARVHPVAVLNALVTYGNGFGVRGKNTWVPVPSIVDALDDAFYLSFGAVVPTGKRLLFGLDVSGSMGCTLSGNAAISCRMATAAMAMACVRSESRYYVMGFSDRFVDLGITARMRLDQAVSRVSGLPFMTTDCSLPMQWAIANKVEADAFIVMTDNETFAGSEHPSQALRRYREATGIAARQVVVGMTSTGFTIADPKDALALDVVGFDLEAPQAISEFVRG